MKNYKYSILIILISLFGFSLQSCDNSDDPSAKEVTEAILQSKTWKTNSVVVPDITATESNDWLNFSVAFTTTMMNTSGHPAGAEAVWPSGSYTVSDDGKQIARQDGVVMQLTNVTESSITASFSVPAGTEINGRIAALDGDYVFNLE